MKIKKFTDFKKYKGIKLKLAAISLVLPMAIGSFSSKNSGKYQEVFRDDLVVPPTSSSQTTQDAFTSQNSSENQITDDIINDLSQEIELDEGDVQEVIADLSDIIVDYPYSELFDIDEALAEESATIIAIPDSSTQLIVNSKVDENELYQQILQNNEEYLSQNKGITKYNGTTNSLIKKVCAVIAPQINEYLSGHDLSEQDINYLNEKLSDLKIFNYDGYGYASYNPDRATLEVSEKMISNLQRNTGESQTFEKVVSHEIAHLLQAPTQQTILQNNIMQFGPCIKHSGEQSTLYWDWYIEGSAEQLCMDYYETNESLTYPAEIKALTLMKTAGAVDPSVDVTTLEELSLQSSREPIYEYFKCTTEEEEKEILNMFYATNLFTSGSITTSNQIFVDNYSSKHDPMDGSTQIKLEDEWQGCVAATTSKTFYKNLAILISEKDLQLDEIFSLISMYENNVSNLTWYSSKRQESLLDNYTKYQDIFFRALAESNHIDKDELVNSYTKFHDENKANISEDMDLTSSQKEYFQDILDKYQGDKKEPIVTLNLSSKTYQR